MKQSKFKIGDKLLVVWHDAQVADGGFNPAKYIKEYKPCIRKTLGFYIGQKDGVLFIAETDDREAGNWCDEPQDFERVNALPLCMIKELKVLNG